MKILLLRANPRKNGHTSTLIDWFVSGMRSAGADVNDIDLTLKDVRMCKGCYHCWIVKPGTCVQHDDMSALIEAFLESDILVCASPLYAYSVAASLKIFMERTFPLLSPGVTLSPAGIDRNKIRYPDKGPRKMAAILAGGLKDISNSRGAVETLRLYAEGFNMEFCGALVRPESYLLQFEQAKPKQIKIIETAFIQAGKQLVTEGRIEPDLIEKASSPLSKDLRHFERYSNVYWEIAQSIGKGAYDLDVLRDIAYQDVRILMYEMARSVDPVSTSSVKAILYFHFPDKNYHYALFIDKGSCTVDEKEAEKYDLKVTCTSATWAEIIRRELDPLKAFTSGELKLQGDKSLFRKLDRYFPPPV